MIYWRQKEALVVTLPDLSRFITHRTQHYIFHVHPGSVAQRDLPEITREQERCFARITQELGVTPEEPLHYILCDTPRECAAFWHELFEDDSYSELNGFADCPYAVYAVYNEEIRCIGAHEDAHIIAHRLHPQPCAALCEGLAMYFDGVWWGEANEAWVRRFLADGRYLPLRELMDNDRFYDLPCEVTYPIVGAFTRYGVERLGMQGYLRGVYAADGDVSDCIRRAFHQDIESVEKDFLAHITTPSTDDKGACL